MIDYGKMSEEALEQMWDEEQKIEDKAEADSIEKSEDPEVECCLLYTSPSPRD